MLPKNSSALTRIKTTRKATDLVGDYGEERVFSLLSIYIRNKFLFSRTITRFAYKKSSPTSREADLIFIFRKGVFVIEVKNWSGIVKGRSIDKKWLNIKKNKKLQTFDNPLMQVNKFTNDVIKLLGSEIPVYSLVVFASDNVTLLNIPNVINSNNLPFYFDRFKPSRTLTDQEILEAYRILEARKSDDNVSIHQHKKDAINSKKYEEDKRKYSDLPAIIRNVKRKY